MLFVMPYLLPFNEPDFEAVGEVVDFVFQSLEVRSSSSVG